MVNKLTQNKLQYGLGENISESETTEVMDLGEIGLKLIGIGMVFGIALVFFILFFIPSVNAETWSWDMNNMTQDKAQWISFMNILLL